MQPNEQKDLNPKSIFVTLDATLFIVLKMVLTIEFGARSKDKYVNGLSPKYFDIPTITWVLTNS